mmetsp:Transcript_24082/g.54050  ORF Transcript_24082/g.54050 Transcript_24082/m.54050 type:complete len:86 (-) Transcript_24082:952-1209(-)
MQEVVPSLLNLQRRKLLDPERMRVSGRRLNVRVPKIVIQEEVFPDHRTIGLSNAGNITFFVSLIQSRLKDLIVDFYGVCFMVTSF